eukprot:TRINITY_DN43776_c0_g1_i1.p1 TRINITY_DN43776_c0_g1~~TRINITY_DN43776_c0_g1_i1.p1  ORF type:complete len:621 (+),score=90.70 TRINITY_DN43776_c0_g1_i1:67-1863(+)
MRAVINKRSFGGSHGGGGGHPSVPEFYWLVLPEDSSLLCKEGLTQNSGPAVFHDKTKEIFSSSTYILGDLVDYTTEVTFTDDPEWKQFPEIGEALTDLGAEENCYLIAVCPSKGKWAVGAAYSWKNRQSAVRIALALALIKDSGKVDEMFRNYPDFKLLCQQSGVIPPEPAALRGSVYSRSRPSPSSWLDGVAQSEFHANAQDVSNPSADMTPTVPGLAWITLAEESTITRGGLPCSAPALEYSKGEAIFTSGHHILRDILGSGDVKDEVVFQHDPDWEKFPEVGRAMKEAGLDENCFVVATVPKKGRWAVGVGSGWKGRELAAKIALSVAMTFDDPSAMDLVTRNYPEFGSFVGGEPTPAGVPPSPVRKKPRRNTQMEGEHSSPWGGPFAQNSKPSCGGDGSMGGGKGGWNSSRGMDMGRFDAFSQRPDRVAPDPWRAPKAFEKSLPRDVPLWVSLPVDQAQPRDLDGLPHGAAVVCTSGKKRSIVYGKIDEVLKKLVDSPQDDIEFLEDLTWEKFPEVATAVNSHGDEEVPMIVAVCRSTVSAWGVGLGANRGCRTLAAKVALATSIVLRVAEDGNEPDLSDFPEFDEFISEVQVA